MKYYDSFDMSVQCEEIYNTGRFSYIDEDLETIFTEIRRFEEAHKTPASSLDDEIEMVLDAYEYLKETLATVITEEMVQEQIYECFKHFIPLKTISNTIKCWEGVEYNV